MSPVQAHSRPYSLLAHAETLLHKSSTSRETRADVLSNLKRAADQRVKHLVEQFNLGAVPLADRPRGSLDILEYFGLIRPLMAGKLFALRNAVEHEDEVPPERERLQEFCEFTWYFLRSTDVPVRPSGWLTFDSPYLEGVSREEATAPPYRVEIWVEPHGTKPWECRLRGLVPASALTSEHRDDHSVVDLISRRIRDDHGGSDDRLYWESRAQRAGEDDVVIHATLRGNADHIRQLVKRYILFS